jgi:beta-aspartyl-peptidase (threonine type)
MRCALAVHGGAWNVPDADLEDHANGVAAALRAGWGLLREGASAIDTVEHVVRMLEDDPVFNAGKGSHLNRLGRVEMDASIMEGDGLEAGAVAAVERVRHPITLARRVMEDSPHVLLVGHGALAFAEDHGVELCRSRDLLVGRAREQYLRIRAGETSLIDSEFAPAGDDDHMGTVGAVALDGQGLVAAGTSTGGTLDKYPGRVGDSPLIGAGTYADSRSGAASCTGWGEGILRVVMAKAALDRLGAGLGLEAAGAAALDDLHRVGGRAGMILLDARGGATAVYNTPRMARGIATADGLRVGVDSTMDAC